MRIALGAVAFALCLWALAEAQEGPTKKTKGQLPSGWKKLNLTAEQKAAVYKVRANYGDKIHKLEMEIKILKDDEHKAMVAILTDAQKKELAKGLGLEPADPKKPKESK